MSKPKFCNLVTCCGPKTTFLHAHNAIYTSRSSSLLLASLQNAFCCPMTNGFRLKYIGHYKYTNILLVNWQFLVYVMTSNAKRIYSGCLITDRHRPISLELHADWFDSSLKLAGCLQITNLVGLCLPGCHFLVQQIDHPMPHAILFHLYLCQLLRFS